MRIVVIGGGIVGASIAFHLQLKGLSVTLLDREREPPTGASRASFAWMNARDKNPRAYHDLNRRSLDMWPRFASRLGVDVQLQWGGDIRWTTTVEQARETEERIRQLQSWGYPVRVIDRAEAERLAPGITFRDFASGSLSELDGHVDAVATVEALHRAGKRLGMDIRFGTAVTGFARSSDIEAVKTESDAFPCEVCVLAAGAATADIARLVGVEIPMYDTFGATVVTSPIAPLFDGPSVLHGPKNTNLPLALRQFGDGTVVLHGGRPGHAHEESFGRTDEEAELLMAEAVRIAPGLVDAEIRETRRARRPIPEDGQSVLGYSDIPNLYVAVTHSGVTLAPLIGEMTAIEIGDGQEVDLLDPFRPGRFRRKT